MDTVTILGRAGCGACIFTERAFELAGLSFVVADVDEDAGAAAIAREIAGELERSELPVGLFEDGSLWTGLQLNRIADLVRAV